APRPGETFTARVGWDLPEGWGVTSTAWSGGICGATAPVGDSSPRQEQAFTAEAGRFCVSVIVTLSPPAGGSRNEERAVDFEVAPTTTAPPPTTTTTELPPTTTTTTTEPPPESTTTTTTQPSNQQ